MKTLVILAHPNIEQSKVNKVLKAEISTLTNVKIHELYTEYPDMNINIEREQNLLMEHERIVFQFPFYWYSVPPILKKWMDDVLTYGWAYGSTGKNLHGKELLIAITTGGPSEAYLAGGYNNYTISELLRPIQATSNLIGTIYKTPFVFNGVLSASTQEILDVAKSYKKLLED